MQRCTEQCINVACQQTPHSSFEMSLLLWKGSESQSLAPEGKKCWHALFNAAGPCSEAEGNAGTGVNCKVLGQNSYLGNPAKNQCTKHVSICFTSELPKSLKWNLHIWTHFAIFSSILISFSLEKNAQLRCYIRDLHLLFVLFIFYCHLQMGFFSWVRCGKGSVLQRNAHLESFLLIERAPFSFP